jgi:putative membrane protein (TIGR04086 family)
MHWGRIAWGGFLAELALILAVVPAFLIGGEPALTWAAVIGSPVTTFLVTWWMARHIRSRLVLHGALIGLTACLIYVALTLAQPEPPIYIVAHGLKIAGGALGGLVASRRRSLDTAGVAA